MIALFAEGIFPFFLRLVDAGCSDGGIYNTEVLKNIIM
jgi:hypothetical protein